MLYLYVYCVLSEVGSRSWMWWNPWRTTCLDEWSSSILLCTSVQRSIILDC